MASRVERTLSKAEIFELYLNSVYLGRGSWGIELAARSYFGKAAKELTLEEGALLAGLTKGPSYFSPDRYPGRAQERLAYVLEPDARGRGAARRRGRAGDCPRCPRWWPMSGRAETSVSISSIRWRARPSAVAGIDAITANSYTVRSTIIRPLQRAVEEALQEGLWRYERNAGRLQFRGPEANLAKAVASIEAEERLGTVPDETDLAAGARECTAAAL